MLRLIKISLTQFKNYSFSSFEFQGNVCGICGPNGRGKTNLLDAIYYCCFARSYFNNSDSSVAGTGTDGFRIQGSFMLNGEPAEIICVVRPGNRKEISVNGIPYEKLSAHLGRFPVVMIAPDDIALVTEGGEYRRKYLDTLLSQLDQEYLQNLIVYNKVLQQRNSLLKNYYQQGSNESVLDILDQQLIPAAILLHQRRRTFLQELIPRILQYYNFISDQSEQITAEYESQLHDSDFNLLLANNRLRDIQLQRTTTGIHRDDINIQMNGRSFRQIASQGQKKSLLFSMKLAEFESIKEKKGFAPLLLLDDIFEKLDEGRMNRLLNRVCNQNNGHVFITDTHCDRLRHALDPLETDQQVINL